ncbi:MAG TPA: hypothetical protein DIU11_09610, partial [Pusillimonas sp.]|nr:hypothetical protein [Pusillimonas sp.]
LEGSGRNQIIRVVLLLASTSVVELKIDPAIVMATRKYVDDLVSMPSGVEPKTYGNESEYPVFTVDARGRIVHAGTIKSVSVWDDIPETNIGDIIFVKGLGEMWWTDNEFITGYRTKMCGMPPQTLDRAARSWTMQLRGGTFDKSLKKYQGLYSWILENDNMVPSAEYEDGEGFFCELGGNIVKVPNLDNMFYRNGGTDFDTANARALGSKQLEAFKSHLHNSVYEVVTDVFEPGSINRDFVQQYGGTNDVRTLNAGGAETRPNNTAFAPIINL